MSLLWIFTDTDTGPADSALIDEERTAGIVKIVAHQYQHQNEFNEESEEENEEERGKESEEESERKEWGGRLGGDNKAVSDLV